MESLFARYFDGDLDDREVKEFLEAVEKDPKLERELRAYEQVLAIGKAIPVPDVPAGFTERVTADLPVETRVKRAKRAWTWPALSRVRWAPVAAVAAALVVAYAGGWWSGRDRGGAPGETLDARVSVEETRYPSTDIVPVTVGQRTVSGTGLRYVRLVYVPAHAGVQEVTVAGSFNDWKPNSTPMQRQNGTWSTILVLSPGTYEYMFVEDGDRWVTDPLAIETRDDGFGGMNAVLDVES